MHAKIDARHHCQRPEASNQELSHIQPRDILHHHAARFYQLPFQSRKRHANHEIARRAEAAPHRAIRIGRHHPAHGRLRRERRIERHRLPISPEQRLQL